MQRINVLLLFKFIMIILKYLHKLIILNANQYFYFIRKTDSFIVTNKKSW